MLEQYVTKENILTVLPALCVIGYKFYPEIKDWFNHENIQDKLYSDNHVWIKEIGYNTFLLGVSDYLNKKYSNFNLVSFRDPNKYRKNTKIATLISLHNSFEIRAPCDLRIEEVYKEVNNNINELCKDYEGTPLMKISIKKDNRYQLNELISTENYNNKYMSEGTVLNN